MSTDVLTARSFQEGDIFEILGTLVPVAGKKSENQGIILNCRLNFDLFSVFKVKQFKVVV